MKQHYHFLLY